MKDYPDGARYGSEGNARLLKDYGGSKGSNGTNKCFAHGGSVHGGDEDKKELRAKPHKAEGGEVADGMAAKPRLDRPGRKMKGKGKDKSKGTNVNVIIMSGKGDQGAAPMPGGPPPGGPPPMMGKPPGPPMGPPPTAGGPPMPPMHKHGGKVGKASGGAIHADGQDDKTEAEAEKQVEGRKHGGRIGKATGGALHADGQTSKTELEAEGKIERKHGGSVKMDAGAGGGLGRLEKIKEYGK